MERGDGEEAQGGEGGRKATNSGIVANKALGITCNYVGHDWNMKSVTATGGQTRGPRLVAEGVGVRQQPGSKLLP